MVIIASVLAALLIIASIAITIKYIQWSKKSELKKVEKLLAEGKTVKEIIDAL